MTDEDPREGRIRLGWRAEAEAMLAMAAS